eukprot:TRINITY_DN7890_c0_g1_i3.p1 TRINITY_DN7890_c0_g1~~TRINITY_DN7890_c0_g1_i3.p1  ORF type:complete len:477 (+),score=43.89 TRINITY_DN7890_c0_g1_i3:69-1433(+)
MFFLNGLPDAPRELIVYADETLVSSFNHVAVHPLYATSWHLPRVDNTKLVVGYLPIFPTGTKAKLRRQIIDQCFADLMGPLMWGSSLSINGRPWTLVAVLGDLPQQHQLVNIRSSECRLCETRDFRQPLVAPVTRLAPDSNTELMWWQCLTKPLDYSAFLPCILHDLDLGLLKRVRRLVVESRLWSTLRPRLARFTTVSGRVTATACVNFCKNLRVCLAGTGEHSEDLGVLAETCLELRKIVHRSTWDLSTEAQYLVQLERLKRLLVVHPEWNSIFESKKTHMLGHLPDLARKYGSPVRWSGRDFEAFHKVGAKLAWKKTNRNWLAQVVRFTERRERVLASKRLKEIERQSQERISRIEQQPARTCSPKTTAHVQNGVVRSSTRVFHHAKTNHWVQFGGFIGRVLRIENDALRVEVWVFFGLPESKQLQKIQASRRDCCLDRQRDAEGQHAARL